MYKKMLSLCLVFTLLISINSYAYDKVMDAQSWAPSFTESTKLLLDQDIKNLQITAIQVSYGFAGNTNAWYNGFVLTNITNTPTSLTGAKLMNDFCDLTQGKIDTSNPVLERRLALFVKVKGKMHQLHYISKVDKAFVDNECLNGVIITRKDITRVDNIDDAAYKNLLLKYAFKEVPEIVPGRTLHTKMIVYDKKTITLPVKVFNKFEYVPLKKFAENVTYTVTTNKGAIVLYRTYDKKTPVITLHSDLKSVSTVGSNEKQPLNHPLVKADGIIWVSVDDLKSHIGSTTVTETVVNNEIVLEAQQYYKD